MFNPTYVCPKCEDWVEILPTTKTDDFKCPWCGERLRLDVDYDNPGTETQRDLSKLVTFRSHWDEADWVLEGDPPALPGESELDYNRRTDK